MDLLPSGLYLPSITEQRASIGLTTPGVGERHALWESLDIPQAGVLARNGGYRPHRIKERLHVGPWRFVAEGGGLRGGKSLGSAVEGISWLPHSNLIWLAAETYDLTRQEFEYMAEGATSQEWVNSITMPKNKYQPCAFDTPWGCTVETRSLHDLGSAGQGASLTARAPDLIIICEPGFAPAETLKQARERLTTRRGRLWMAGTFEQANTWFTELWHKWVRYPNEDMGKSMAIPSWLNTASFPTGRADPEIQSIKKGYATLREFLVRWGGVPLASEALVMGAYWDQKKHVRSDAEFQMYDNEGHKQPVYLAVDPGYSGNSVYAVLVLQKRGSMWVCIDEVIGRTLVAEEVIDLCRTRPWWGHVAGGIIDPYAGVNHVYGGFSPIEVWWRHGRVVLQAAPRYEVEDVTARLQLVLRSPENGRTALIVNSVCKHLIWEMEHWRRVKTRDGLGEPSKIQCDALKALAYFMSAKYTESALGYSPGNDPVTVGEWSVGGMTGGTRSSRVNRYQHYR